MPESGNRIRSLLAAALPLAAGRRTIQYWLLWLVVACIVPAAAGTALLILQSYEREKLKLETSTIATARALMATVDADIAGAQAALQTLAALPQASGDLARFYDHAVALVPSQTFNNIVLKDLDGQQLANTLKPFGSPLPKQGLPALQKRVIETGQPAVSDLFFGPVAKRPLVIIEVPVLVDDKVVRTLAAGIFTDRLGEILNQQRIPPDWVATIVDSAGIVVARTRDPERFIGQKAPAARLAAMAREPEGSVETNTMDGVPVVSGYSRSQRSGWTVSIGVPTAILTAGLRESLLLNAAVALLPLALGILLAVGLGRRIVGDIRSVAGLAHELGARGVLAAPALAITEIDELGQALVRASVLIELRGHQRDEAERAEGAMLLAKQASDRSSDAKSTFVSTTSHELRTPMNGILGYAQLLDTKLLGALNSKQQEYVDHIMFSGKHLLRLINDVLDLSNIEAGRLTMSLEPVDPARIVKAAMATLETAAAKAGVRLIVGKAGPGIPSVTADPERLMQAILNFGSNAVKYSRAGGSATFAVERLAGGLVRISVTDGGIGIRDDRQAHVFEPFNRLGAESTAVEGTGIGLALTRRIVELMGGKVGFSSKVGTGSRFWIDLPESGAAQAAAPAVAKQASVVVRPVPGLSVLSIEDNPANMSLVRNILVTCRSATMLEAVDGGSGLAMARAHRPHLIVLDINLPDIDGYEVLRQLRADPELLAIPVIAVTAAAMRSDVQRGIESGFFRYLTKPLDVNVFLAAIDDGILAARAVGDTADKNTGSVGQKAV